MGESYGVGEAGLSRIAKVVINDGVGGGVEQYQVV